MASAPQKVFGDRTFAFGTIPPSDALDIQVDIVRIFGEGVLRLLIGHGREQAAQLEAFAAAIRTIASHPNAKTLKQEVKDMLSTAFRFVTCAGAPVTFDITFHGKNKELWLVFAEAVKTNFADFFQEGPSPSDPATPPS